MPAAPSENSQFDNSVLVEGWSRGYVAFVSVEALQGNESTTTQIATASSTDGVHWKMGSKLDLAGLADETIEGAIEGPAGLVAIGREGLPGCDFKPVQLWLSSDGSAWRRLETPAFSDVGGGPSGYAAWDASMIWTSRDAISWVPTDMAKGGSEDIRVGMVASFAQGFVATTTVPLPDTEVCRMFKSRTHDAWLSSDGTKWSASDLVMPTGASAELRVSRITDKALLAAAETYDEQGDLAAEKAWTSLDGIHWKAVSNHGISMGSSIAVTDGSRGLIANQLEPKGGPVDLWIFNDDLTLRKLGQSGDVPWEDMEFLDLRMGPNGLLLARNDGSNLWIGTPITG